ncbi:anti-sigma factor family protein [Humisphaera borealis]|uniref:Zf-HC2 domain-containing protein n=1 Tax=Humisphaera borealis TaxID=2807512 RepID=A0A7M2WVU7_9BACT|nr:zf-HC2 domain-containing protein [Humisphaera borealis]QOV89543.1 zf-HC2 domain-containing protein [Humisphaera borealis]
MTCRELIDFLEEYVDGNLPSTQREVFEEHIDECLDCKNYLDSYRKTIHLSRKSFEGAEFVTSEVPEGLVRAVLALRR